MKLRFPREPAAVLLANRTVGRLHLRVMKDRLAKDEVAVRSPCEVMQGVVRVLATEPGQDGLSMVGLAVAISVLEEAHVGFLGNKDPAVAELEGKGHVQVIGPDRGLVRLAVAVEVLEDDDLVIGRTSWIDMRVGG